MGLKAPFIARSSRQREKEFSMYKKNGISFGLLVQVILVITASVKGWRRFFAPELRNCAAVSLAFCSPRSRPNGRRSANRVLGEVALHFTIVF
jgi:hypothetical protein